MKKSTKYSAVIAAALLAVAPMAISNTVKADATNKPATEVTQSANNNVVKNDNNTVQFDQNKNDSYDANQNQSYTVGVKDSDHTSTTNTNPVKGMSYSDFAQKDQNFREKYSDGTKEHPFIIEARENIQKTGSVTRVYRPMTIAQATDDFIDEVLSKTNHVYAYDYLENGMATTHGNLKINYYYSVYDKNGKKLDFDDSDYVKDGEKIVFNGGLMDKPPLRANVWYSWIQPKTLKDYLGDDLESDLSKFDYEEAPINGGYLVAAKTDNNGNFAKINVNNDDEPETITEYLFAPVELRISMELQSQPSQPNDAAQPETPVQPTEAAQPTQASQATTAAQSSTPAKEDEQQPTTPVETPAAKKPLMIKHNAFIYNKHGKLVKKNGVYSVLKKYEDVKPLRNRKVITIKGKKFYQIGRNRYVKVANTTVKPGLKKVSTKGTVKGIKSVRVRLYNANGKYINKHVNGKKNLKFDAKKIIKGHLYYRIKGTNNWIRASKVRLHK